MLRAESLIEQTLQTLPVDRWEWQRQVLVDGNVLPFLIFGETGVFAVWGAIGPVLWEEPARIRARAALPRAAARPTIPERCTPRSAGRCTKETFSRAGGLTNDGVGAWVMGLSSLTEWMEHFGTDNGVGVGDLNQLRQLRDLIAQGGPVPRHPNLIPDL